MKKVSSLMNDGDENGPHVLQSAADIEFRSDDERISVESEAGIEKPRVLQRKNGFVWKYFEWASVGSGSITRNTLVVDFEDGVSLTQEVVLRNIGLWRQSR